MVRERSGYNTPDDGGGQGEHAGHLPQGGHYDGAEPDAHRFGDGGIPVTPESLVLLNR